MPITDPEAINFVDETIRPLSEAARALYYEVKAAAVKWGNVSANIPNTADIVEDGREDQGVSRLTGANVRVVTGFLSAYIAAYENATVAAMDKPTVRRLNVS